MKENDIKLSIQETEQLCGLYMDCKLSVVEETELLYILTRVDYHTPLIDDVRVIMGIYPESDIKMEFNNVFKRKQLLRKCALYLSAAASVAIIIGFGFSYWKTSSQDIVESQTYYIAYEGGHRLSDDEARLQIEDAIKSTDNFIRRMSELEAQEQQMIDNFFKL